MHETLRRLTLLGTIVLSTAPALAGGPCSTAKKGTYLSNVCWLIEKFSEKGLSMKIVSANQTTCTVKLSKHLRNPMGTYGDTIYFNRVDPKDVKIEWNRYTTCWHMVGEGVNGRGSNKVVLCGAKIETSRVRRAFLNLYTRYCKGKRSEF